MAVTLHFGTTHGGGGSLSNGMSLRVAQVIGISVYLYRLAETGRMRCLIQWNHGRWRGPGRDWW